MLAIWYRVALMTEYFLLSFIFICNCLLSSLNKIGKYAQYLIQLLMLYVFFKMQVTHNKQLYLFIYLHSETSS